MAAGSGLTNGLTYFVRNLLGSLVGTGFGGKRDYYQVFGWNRNPTHIDFISKYIRQDIAARVINAPVWGTWTDGPMLEADAGFNEAWKKVVDESDAFFHLGKADSFAGLGAFSVLVIGIDDGRRLNTPVSKPPAGVTRKITYLQPYLEGSVEVILFDEDMTSPRFGQPVMYRITPGESILDRRSVDARLRQHTKFEVHWSRLVHLADNTLENRIFGHSRLEPIYNTLDDILKVSGGSAETYWLTANRGMQVDVDKDVEMDPDDADNLAEEVDEYEHGLRRIIRTRGVKVNSLGSNVADPKNTFGVLLALLSANTGIPQRVLMGAEAGQLASQQDRANWAVTLEQRIKNFAQPQVLKPFVMRLMTMHVLPTPTSSVVINWPEPFKMNPLERAQTSAQQARSATNLARTLSEAQKMKVRFISVEEAREIVAPGDKVLVLTGPAPTAGATYPPDLSTPYNEPKNKLLTATPTNPAGSSDDPTQPQQPNVPGNGAQRPGN